MPETVAMLAERESNASTEPVEDVAQDHTRDPEVEWLELHVEAPCGVRPRPVTCDKPRHAAKNDCVFGSNCLFTNVFQNF